MSANDFIAISKSTFEVEHRDMDSGEVISKIGQGKNIEDAIDKAEKWQDETKFYVEYGIYFIK